jgi:predicted AlkP superfamily phosphohydrolase/phosphomutase
VRSVGNRGRAWPVAVALAAATACGDGAPRTRAKPAHPRGLIVLGIDGMDPVITRRLLAAGELPHLRRLAERGGFVELATTSPPQSPVAWSTFVTGLGPDGHGIFDFVHRDPHHLEPYLSTSRTSSPDAIELGSLAVPIGSPSVELLREGVAFWQLLEEHRVPATVVKVPANFPPATSQRAESMAGMGTPDLLGTYGTFQLFTDDPAATARTASGGLVHAVDLAGGDVARGRLIGPPDPLSSAGDALAIDVEIVRDPAHDLALVRLGGAEIMLVAGEWSDWLPVGFSPSLVSSDVRGMVRLHLRQVRPTLHLYVSPINLDPLDPAMPISSPPAYAAGLAADIGRYYTQGMPEDTKALSAGALSATEFLAIADRVMDETEATLDRELARFRGGLLFVYLSSIDQTSHVFFRSLDPDAPAADRAHADAIPRLYRRVDRWIGRLLDRTGADTHLIVMSDHGFAPYRTKVHLNTYLAQRGYLVPLPADQRRPGALGHIDWSQTQAYALGLNQVFLNVRGRETSGVVDPGEREVVLRRVERDLLALRDPEAGATAITRVDRPRPGQFATRAPDLIVGYRRGYRSSDESALGSVGGVVFEPNRDQWSGDHCMDPAEVPGVLVTSFGVPGPDPGPGLADLAPSILAYFGIPAPGDWPGTSFIEEN